MTDISTDRPAAYALTVPANWYLLPEEGEDPEARFQEILVQLEAGPETAAALRPAFGQLLELASVLKPGQRKTYGFVASAERGVADAIMSFRLTSVTADAYGEYLAAVETASTGASIRVVNREVAEARVPAGRAVVLNDVLALDDQQGIVSPALERAIVAVFLDTTPVLFEVYVSTQNLGRFPDIAEFALEIAGGYLPEPTE